MMTPPNLLVLAKAPIAGRVKTRLCPPFSMQQAALIAAAALADTIEAVSEATATNRALVLDGEYSAPAGWQMIAQRDGDLDRRLTAAFTDSAIPGAPSVLIGMDTPQVTATALDQIAVELRHHDAVLAPAFDGGWWGLALRDPSHAVALIGVPTSTSRTAHATASALRRRGLRVAIVDMLRDVDTVEDALAVRAQAPHTRFASAVNDCLSAHEGRRR
jgi:rSAM/selenodomain-associated transferase 1